MLNQDSQSVRASRDSIEEQLIFGDQYVLGVIAPEFDGFTVELHGHRVNLWWYDGHCTSRAFSDAFLTRDGHLAVVVAGIVCCRDASGLAISVRAILRGLLFSMTELEEIIESLEHWGQQEPQWDGYCDLGLAVLQRDHKLRYIRRGNIDIMCTDADGHMKQPEDEITMPVMLDSSHLKVQQTHSTIVMARGDTVNIMVADRAVPGLHLSDEPTSFAAKIRADV